MMLIFFWLVIGMGKDVLIGQGGHWSGEGTKDALLGRVGDWKGKDAFLVLVIVATCLFV